MHQEEYEFIFILNLIVSLLILNKLDDIDANMSKSRRILTQMYVKVLSNKIVLGILIILELITIAILVYFRFFYSSSSS